MKMRVGVVLRVAAVLVMVAAATAATSGSVAKPASASGGQTVAGPITFDAPVNIPGVKRFYDISCPSSSLCVAVGEYDRPAGDLGNQGVIAWSSNPTGGASTWTTYRVSGVVHTVLYDVSCPTESLCVVSDRGVTLMTSTDPTDTSKWNAAAVHGIQALRELDCSSATLCVAVGMNKVLTSTNPAGGAGTWTATAVTTSNNHLSIVSCVSTSLCVASDDNGHVLSSTNPAAGATSWSEVDIGQTLWALSCPHTLLCVGSDSAGNIVTSTDPTGDASAWTSTTVDGTTDIRGMTCPTGRLCVAADHDGKVLTSTDPTGGASAWQATNVGDNPSNVSCSSPALGPTRCVVLNANGAVMAGTATVPGRLRVTTSPALPSKISVDGHVANTWGLAWLEIAPGPHEVCFSDVQGYTTPGCRTLFVVSGQTTTWTGSFTQRGFLKVETSPAVPSAISIDGHPANNWGVYTDIPVGNHQVCFGAVQGMNPPACQNVQVTAGTTKTITGTFTTNPSAPGPTNVGSLRVTSNPPVPTQISVDGHIANTWGLSWLQLPAGNHEVCFSDIAGYATPDCATVEVNEGQTTTLDGAFTQNGFLKVETDPAKDRLIEIDAQPANNWGVYTNVTPGQHRVCFEAVYYPFYGPGCKDVTVNAGNVTTLTGTYGLFTFP